MAEGHMLALGPCFTCKQLFEFDPETVPSVPIDPTTGVPPDIGGTDPANAVNQPVCPPCVQDITVKRKAAGKTTWSPRWTA